MLKHLKVFWEHLKVFWDVQELWALDTEMF